MALRFMGDHEFLAELAGHTGQRADHRLRRNQGQEPLGEVLPHLVVARNRPAGLAGAGEPAEDPGDLGGPGWPGSAPTSSSARSSWAAAIRN